MKKTNPASKSFLPTICPVDSLGSAFPLEKTAVQVQITGMVASVMVAQTFNNPLLESADLDYLCPLPEDAAITAFEMRIDQQVIRGALQEREAAREAFEAARSQGKQASLFEARRENLFATRIANVPAGAGVEVTVRYQQRLKVEEDGWTGVYEYVFPMGLTPRYDRADHPEEAQGVHAPVALPGEPVGPVEIQVAVDAGVPVDDPTSPSHPLAVTRLDEQRFQVRLAEKTIPDHDFVLRYAVSSVQVQSTAWVTGVADKAYFMATIVPPRLDAEPQPLPREFIFVLDRSGSMSGEPIRQARNALRACLRTLGSGDTFRILLFDDYQEWFQPEPSVVTQAEVAKADQYLDQVQGRGGTEIGLALQSALMLPPDPGRARFVVFLTDGAVSAEAALLEDLRKWIGAARVFSFGVGPSVNRALLNRMAEIGRGRASFLQLDEDIEGAIIRFQDSVSFPVLTDLAVEWVHGQAQDVYPSPLRDLYSGQPLELCGLLSYDAAMIPELVVHGKRGGQAVELRQAFSVRLVQDPTVPRVWAQARVDHLLEQQQMEPGQAAQLRQEILDLALEHQLATPYTSFVAVDESGKQGVPARFQVFVSQPLPKGLQAAGFGLTRAAGQPMPMAAPPSAPTPVMKMASYSGLRESSPQPGIKLPGFLTRRGNRAEPSTGAAAPLDAYNDPSPLQPMVDPVEEGLEPFLRWLARNQQMDGSWKGDVEWTAVALLVFLRAGQTPRSGIYRTALRRAARWLAEQTRSSGGELILTRKAAAVRKAVTARALQELADATGDPQDQSAADQARKDLSQPDTDLEKAALGQPVAAPVAIHHLEDIRLAALMGVKLPLPAGLARQEEEIEIVRLWSALLV